MTRDFRNGLGLLLVGGLLLACTSAGAGGPPPSAPPGGAVITAAGTAFDRSTLNVPAGRPFQLVFENREGAPHNVRIYDEGVDQPLFVGEIFSGAASQTYNVPSIPAGPHRFRCDVHTEMSGALIAGG